jgi:hypothetical protein
MKLKAVMLLQGDVDKEFAADGHDLDRCDSIQEDEVSFFLNTLTAWCSYFTNILCFGVQDALNSKKDLDNCGTKTLNEVGVLFPNLLPFVAATVLLELGMVML